LNDHSGGVGELGVQNRAQASLTLRTCTHVDARRITHA